MATAGTTAVLPPMLIPMPSTLLPSDPSLSLEPSSRPAASSISPWMSTSRAAATSAGEASGETSLCGTHCWLACCVSCSPGLLLVCGCAVGSLRDASALCACTEVLSCCPLEVLPATSILSSAADVSRSINTWRRTDDPDWPIVGSDRRTDRPVVWLCCGANPCFSEASCSLVAQVSRAFTAPGRLSTAGQVSQSPKKAAIARSASPLTFLSLLSRLEHSQSMTLPLSRWARLLRSGVCSAAALMLVVTSTWKSLSCLYISTSEGTL